MELSWTIIWGYYEDVLGTLENEKPGKLQNEEFCTLKANGDAHKTKINEGKILRGITKGTLFNKGFDTKKWLSIKWGHIRKKQKNVYVIRIQKHTMKLLKIKKKILWYSEDKKNAQTWLEVIHEEFIISIWKKTIFQMKLLHPSKKYFFQQHNQCLFFWWYREHGFIKPKYIWFEKK